MGKGRRLAAGATSGSTVAGDECARPRNTTRSRTRPAQSLLGEARVSRRPSPTNRWRSSRQRRAACRCASRLQAAPPRQPVASSCEATTRARWSWRRVCTKSDMRQDAARRAGAPRLPLSQQVRRRRRAALSRTRRASAAATAAAAAASSSLDLFSFFSTSSLYSLLMTSACGVRRVACEWRRA